MKIDRRAMMIAGSMGLAAGGAQAEAVTPAAMALLGPWKLVDADTIYRDGRVTPWNGRPKTYEGLIVYLPQGLMTVQISAARAPQSSRDASLTPAEKAAYYDTYYGYFGRFEVDEAASVVSHHIVSALEPGEIGVTYRRHFDLSGDILTLKTLQDANEPKDSYNRLVWRWVT